MGEAGIFRLPQRLGGRWKSSVAAGYYRALVETVDSDGAVKNFGRRDLQILNLIGTSKGGARIEADGQCE